MQIRQIRTELRGYQYQAIALYCVKLEAGRQMGRISDRKPRSAAYNEKQRLTRRLLKKTF
jgi:hypothetical protein